MCSESRRTWDLSSCLGAIRRRAENNKLFWFGSEYVSKCGDKSEFSADCYNPKPYSEDSVVSRIFQRGDYDKKNLDRFMEITFIAQPGRVVLYMNIFIAEPVKVVSYIHHTARYSGHMCYSKVFCILTICTSIEQ